MNIYLLLALASLTSFALAYFIIPVVIETAHKKGLFDLPDARKQHTQPTPPLGGIAIFLGMVGSILFWGDAATFELIRFPLLAMLFLFFVGLKDDLLEMKALKKLVIQLLLALIVAVAGLRITSLNGFIGIYELPIVVQYVLTILFIVGLTNAYNLIDGIDGLAGGIASIAGLTFALLFFHIGDYGFAICSLAMVGALLGFLKYNFSPAKIFMGDTGSLSVGVLLSILAVRLLGQAYLFEQSLFHADWIPVWIFAVLAVPMLDITQVMIKRIMEKRSPFSPDRGHVHHMLQRIGYNHAQASITLYAVSLQNVCMTWLFSQAGLNSNLGFVLILGLSLLELSCLIHFEKSQEMPTYMQKIKQVLIVIQSYLF
ncbi:MAG: MraY family glycosyltransferase [Bacteroidota bacterium]